MSGFFESMFRYRIHTLVVLCIIGFSSKAALPSRYIQLNDQGKQVFETTRSELIRIPAHKVWKWINGVSGPDSLVYQLTPSLTIVTKPLGEAKNNANVTFYNGSLLLYTVTVTQTAPVFVCKFDLILGNIKIEQGMQLTLQIPSSLQPGSFFLQATFNDLNIPKTTISAMVATWNL